MKKLLILVLVLLLCTACTSPTDFSEAVPAHPPEPEEETVLSEETISFLSEAIDNSAPENDSNVPTQPLSTEEETIPPAEDNLSPTEPEPSNEATELDAKTVVKDSEDTVTETASSHTTYIRSKVNSLRIRSAPDLSSEVLGTLKSGQMVAYRSEENGWYVTSYRNRTAYLSANPSYTEKVSLPTADKDIERVISLASELLGTPYVYGATRLLYQGRLCASFDINAFDCSSLMQYVFYYGANTVLNETTRTQVTQGQHVDKSDLARGDLIFMTNASRCNKSGIERVGHVALYLGNNYILHTASDYAAIEEFSSARQANFIEARRML